MEVDKAKAITTGVCVHRAGAIEIIRCAGQLVKPI